MRRFLLSVLALLAFIAFVPAAHAQTMVDVKGMVCDFCAQSLNKVFLENEAVESLDVNLDKQTVFIAYKDGAEALDDKTITQLIEWAGYDVVGIDHDVTLEDESNEH